MLNTIINLLHMGGYGIYIWPCYALLLVLITWQVLKAFQKDVSMQNSLKQNLCARKSSD